MSDIHAIRELEELEKIRNFHRWLHAYFLTRPPIGKGTHVTIGINGAVFRAMIEAIGYTPYVPVGDKDCRFCKKLGLDNWLTDEKITPVKGR